MRVVQSSAQKQEDMSPAELAASRERANSTFRKALTDGLAALDAGKNVAGFVLGVGFEDDDECVVAAGGEGQMTLSLLDVASFGLISNAVRAGIMVPGIGERLGAIHSGGQVNPLDLLQVVVGVEEIVSKRERDAARDGAANEATEAVKRASGQN